MSKEYDKLADGLVKVKNRITRAEKDFPGNGTKIVVICDVMLKNARAEDPTVTWDECYDFLLEVAEGKPEAVAAMFEATGANN